MPKQKTPTTAATHLWVKQGKTEHMATLEDALVLSKLKERRERELSSFSITEVSILDLVPSGSTEVSLCWTSTNRKDTVEAWTIRFRDLESEGRGSRRNRRARESQPTKKRKLTVGTTCRQEAKKPKARSTNPSIVSTEGYNDSNDENSLQSLATDPMAESLREGNNAMNKGGMINGLTNKISKASSCDEAKATNNNVQDSDNGENKFPNKEKINLSRKQNFIDLDDEDFDSSDDEAIIYRMKMKQARVKIEQDGLSRVDETMAEVRNPSSTTVDAVVQGSRISAENSPFSEKRRRLAHRSKNEGKSNSDSDYHDSNDDSLEDWRQKKRKRYPNGYDSDSDSDEDKSDKDDNNSTAKEGQTNVTNWMRMKHLFSRHRNYV